MCIRDRLNTGMPSGLHVLDCYPAVRPVRDLACLRADVTFEYDNGVPAGAADALNDLLRRDSLVIQKRKMCIRDRPTARRWRL